MPGYDELVTKKPYILLNSLSVSMFAGGDVLRDVHFNRASLSSMRDLVTEKLEQGQLEVAMVQPETARLVAHLFGLPELADEWAKIAEQRPIVRDDGMARLLFVEYCGPQIEKGATELPEGARIDCWEGFCDEPSYLLHRWGHGGGYAEEDENDSPPRAAA